MTLRQVLKIIGRRWILALTTTILITASAAAYALLVPQSYESTTTVRYSVAASQAFEGLGGYAGMELDLDPFFVTSEEIVDDAAAQTGDSAGELQGSTTVEPVEGVRTAVVAISSEGPTPESSQARANAIADAYSAHLQAQVDAELEELEAELAEAAQERATAMDAVRDDPDDSVAQGQLSQALGAHLDLEEQVEWMNDAGPPATVMQEAAPGGPLGTEPAMLLAIGLVAGLITGCGVALLREQFDDRVRSVEQIQDATEKPVLAEVTRVKKRRRRDLTLPVAGARPTPFNESIRNLRASLQVAYPEEHAVIAVTSPAPGDGKTFLTANLAVSVARSGRSVLFINGDLRRPRAGAHFGLNAEQEGFAEVLQRDASAEQIEELLVPTRFDGLQVLPAGINLDQPGDLLAGDVLARVIERMRPMAEVILIDTPPGMAISDATLLSTQANGVVVVACLNTTKERYLLETLHVLEAAGASVAGIVANKSTRTAHRSYTSYYKDAETADRSTRRAAAGRAE